MRHSTSTAIVLAAGAALLAPASAGAASIFAVVDSGGALVRSSAGAASAHVGAGEYLVKLPKAVSRCAYNATVGNPRTGPYLQPAYAEVALGGASNTVWVGTFDGNGAPLDQPFHVEVTCGKTDWAVIAASGAAARHSATFVSSALVSPPATYAVTFAAPQGSCVWQATVGSPKGAPGPLPAGGASVSYAGGGSIRVQTFDAAGNPTPLPFHLSSTCKLPTTFTAVSTAAGSFVRGRPGTTVSHLGAGLYQVTFTVKVDACAWVATIGDPSDVPPRPATIATGGGFLATGGPDPYSVLVSTHNPLPLGGAPSDRPFHLTVQCP
jgi:hypothetical protein